MMLRAIYFENGDDLLKFRHPGAFTVKRADDRGHWFVKYVCPCGCGALDNILVAINYKPPSSPSWNWNGSRTEPTLAPSVNRRGHWHGYLRDGYWAPV